MGVPPATANPTSPARAATSPAPAQKPLASKAKGALEDPPVTNAAQVSLAVTAAVAPALGAFIVGPSLLAQAKTFPASDLTSRDGVSAWLSLAGAAAGVPATLHVGHGPTVEDALRQIQNPTSVDTLTHFDESRDVGEPPKP
jgi:hypothetical protein